MATNGITDVFATVSVPKPEYEDLLRDSERLKVAKTYVEGCMNSKYQVIDKDALCCALGIEVGESEGKQHESL